MRIGIDLRCIPEDTSQLTGVSNYALMLTKYLLRLETSHHFVLFVRRSLRGVPSGGEGRRGNPMAREIASLLSVARNDAEVVRLPDRVPFYDSHIRAARIIRGQNLDIFHGPAYTLPLFLKSDSNTRIHPNVSNAKDSNSSRSKYSSHSSVNSRHSSRLVITIHDLAIYKHPEWFPEGQWFSTKFLVPRSIKKADRIIVPSQSTKKDLMELFQVSSFKISVVSLGVEERFMKHETHNMKHASSFKFQVSKPYILFVGTLESRKNIARLIKAYSQLPQELIEKYDLVIAGGKGWKYEDIYQTAREHCHCEESDLGRTTKQSHGTAARPVGTRPFDTAQGDLERSRNGRSDKKGKVVFTGPVSSDQLPSLYQNAALFVFPSLYEGFGLPVLEAMAAGIPVITGNISSLPEVVGSDSNTRMHPNVTNKVNLNSNHSRVNSRHSSRSKCAMLVNPYNVSEISEAMKQILFTPYGAAGRSGLDKTEAHRLAKSGVKRARQFTWEKTAKLTLEVYERIIQTH